MNNAQHNEVTRSSGNVFADLGFEDAEEALVKARLASLIYDAVDTAGWTQQQAAEILGLKQSDVSNVLRGRLKNFSLERLLRLLGRLGRQVTITVSSPHLPAEELVLRGTSAATSANI